MTAPLPRPTDTPDGFGSDNRSASENSSKATSAFELGLIVLTIAAITAFGLVAGC